MGLATSFSNCSGEAPGYSTLTATKGGRTSGIASTRSRWYEKMPSTVSATITIVANTGWLMATRVIHMGLSGCGRAGRQGLDHLGAAAALQARGLAVLQVVEFRRDHVLRGLHAREDLDHVSAVVARAHGHRPTLEAAADEEPDVGLRALAAHGGHGQRGGLALGGHGEPHAREHARLEERALVRERHVDVDRARAGLGARVDALDFAVEAALDPRLRGAHERGLAPQGGHVRA